ncbi:integrator complex subunit 7-like [Tetranychus urticae]|uniref:Integrator complex subunit 7 n=1 Tax=Tetranychus urticae TaxID=32264 RepID=T1KQY8_TETUR|nr:integrator complex subunit 7-like [Tetranychus urticae]
MNSSQLDDHPNLDANSLLSELDKGLRSGKMGEECEAIVGFPWLFIRYPFPILINSASLKLADVFRNGSNFSRLLILKVIHESEKHLDKIINMDEFVRRLFNVTYSNDPIARSITLRALASISCIIAERKNIHHVIRHSLDAEDQTESLSAVQAAAAFSKRSVDFALSIYPKVLTLLSKSETPMEKKIRLLSVLHHSHYNSQVAKDVKDACLSFLSDENSDKFACAILNTLTYIATTSLFAIPDHISLLLKHFRHDTRPVVKMSIIKELTTMARTSPHLWSKENVQDFLHCVHFIIPALSKNPTLLSRIMAIFVYLVKCPCLLAADVNYIEPFYQELEKLCLTVHNDCLKSTQVTEIRKNLRLIAVSFQLMTALSRHSDRIKAQTIQYLQNFINSQATQEHEIPSSEQDEESNKIICVCIKNMCNSDETVADQLVSCLESKLKSGNLSNQWIGYTCQIFCSLQHLNISPDFLIHLSQMIIKLSLDEKVDESILSQLLTLHFQTSTRLDIKCSSEFVQHLKGRSHWFYFKIIRQAMRYGHYHVSQIFCELLQNSASSENVHFWMLSLFKISLAESLLVNSSEGPQLTNSLVQAITFYSEALSALKASGSGSYCLIFAGEYVRLRCKLLRAHAALRQSCNLIRTSPAPAIAGTAATTSRDELMKCGSVVSQMRKCAKDFRSLADAYSCLYQTSFNADNETLSHLQLIQHSCTIVAEAIESVFQTNRLSSLFVNKDTHLESDRVTDSIETSIEYSKLNAACHEISKIVRTRLSDQKNSLGNLIDCKHIATLLALSIKLLQVPLCIPRLFFQSIQNTCIKLAISPVPKTPSDPIVTQANTNFALKVEGVIVYGASCRILRNVSKVMLNVNSCLVNKTGSGPVDQLGKPLDTNVSLQSLVTPHNDYFQEQFLLALTTVGIHSINIEASIIDENEAQWKTGPVVNLSVKVHEDLSNK